VHSGRRVGVLSPCTPTASGMAWAEGDGGDAPHWSDVTVLSWESAEQAYVLFSRVPPSPFEGATCQPYESG
jgi:hypothetical protein